MSGRNEIDPDSLQVLVDKSAQVLEVELPDDVGYRTTASPDQDTAEADLLPTLEDTERRRYNPRRFVSASVLAAKAKQVDDRLYAGLELALQQGAGTFAGKEAVLRWLIGALQVHGPGTEADVTLRAAAQLGGLDGVASEGDDPRVQARLSGFLGSERSRPVGFYTWDERLERIYRQDRLLQDDISDAGSLQALGALVQETTPELRAYETYLAVTGRLTNPLTTASLLSLPDGSGPVSLFPPSRSHETDLMRALYGDRPIPDGFSLADTLIERIERGSIDLTPRPESGWYDYLTWALEPLVAPERMPEAARLELGPRYRKQLKDLFRGALALSRETHVKQLEWVSLGAAGMFGTRPPIVYVNPELHVEPLPSYYLRRATGYGFLREWLDRLLGPDALAEVTRKVDGARNVSLAQELDAITRLFRGAYATAVSDLGMEPDGSVASTAKADAEAFARWIDGLENDADVGADLRMMVPVFYDLERKKTKVWAFLGWAKRSIEVSFKTPPKVRVLDDAGRELGEREVELQVTSQHTDLEYPVTVEMYVDRLLNREEFRALCDRAKTRSQIVKELKDDSGHS